MGNVIVRTALATIAGVVVAGLTVFVVEGIGHALFPPPAGLDLSDPADQARVMEEMPAAARVMVVLAWFLGSLTGAAAAMVIARRAAAGWIVAMVMVGLSLWTTQMYPHPAWMVAAAVILPALAAWLASRLLARRIAP